MWRLTSLAVIVALAGAFCIVPATSLRAELVLAVDFGTQDRAPDDTGFSPNRLQPGFQDFSVGPERSDADADSYTVAPPFPSVTRPFENLEVTVADPAAGGNGLFFSDLGTVSHELGPLADDFIASSGPELVVTISGLSPGDYQFTTYHHSLDFTEQYFIGEILATSSGQLTKVASHIPVSYGDSPEFVSSATFQFATDGTAETTIVISRELPLGVPLLNGFSVTRVPEPTGAVLTGAVLLLVPIRKRRN